MADEMASDTRAVKSHVPFEALIEDIELRLDALLRQASDLVDRSLYGSRDRIPSRAQQLARALLGNDTDRAAQAIRQLGPLVNLTQPEDARRALGIALMLLTDDQVLRVIDAQDLLGVSPARVHQLLHDGKLTRGDRERGVSRHSVAERLALRLHQPDR